MTEYSRLLPVLALLPLPNEAQQILSVSDSEDARRALAASTHTSPEIIERLSSDQDRMTHHAALRRMADTDVLHARLDRGTTCCAINVLRNVAVDPDRLDTALSSSDLPVRLAAYVNPATPASSRARLTPKEVAEMVDVSVPLGATVVRSHEALLNNRVLLTRTSEFGHVLRRAAFALADLSVDEYEQLRRTGKTGKYGGRHPVARDRDWVDHMSVDDLLAANSPAVDLWLASDTGTDASVARRMLVRAGHHVEPHVLARLLHRFGTEAVPVNDKATIATTRSDSTAWSNPAGRFYNMVVSAKFDGSYDQLVTAVDDLGVERQAWESFLTLLGSWTGTLPELARTARSL
jgi:hypothetical protein